MQIDEISQGAPIGRVGRALGQGLIQAATGYRFDPDSPGQKQSFEASFLSRLGSIAYRAYLDTRIEAGMLTPTLKFRNGFTDAQIAQDSKPFAIRYFTGSLYYSQLGEEQRVELTQYINSFGAQSWESMQNVRYTFNLIAKKYAELFKLSKEQPMVNLQYLQQLANIIKDPAVFTLQEKQDIIRRLQSIISASRSFQAFRRSRMY